ncbi:CAP domain-containing protein [Sporomusa acidovorans]|nr:CAP domain-containing protein [Sporomusa acidovorans]
MKIKKSITKTILGLVVMSLMTTSFGGVWAPAVYAAEVEDQTVQSGDNKAAIGGLVALGLLAVLAGKKGGHSDSKAKNVTTNNPPANNSNTGSSVPTTSSGLTADESKAFQLLNADRAANGLPALKINSSLVRLAENYAQDMINRKFFSHYNPEGQSPFDRMKQAGISYRYAGENLAINSSVAAAEKAFMNSSGHRANILSPNYTEVGVGVRYDSSGSAYVVQEFIKK